MPLRTAACRCSAVTVACEGEPIRVSVCHCLSCQQRTGSAFGAQARFRSDQVKVFGETRVYPHVGDSGGTTNFRFCPICAATVAYVSEAEPAITAVPLGGFADPGFTPHPVRSIYEARRHPWVAVLGDGVEHED